MQKWVLLLRKETDLANIVQVDVLNPRHLTIHAMLHRHSWRVLRVPEGAHARQVHPCLHTQSFILHKAASGLICVQGRSISDLHGRPHLCPRSFRSRALAGDHSNMCTLRQIQSFLGLSVRPHDSSSQRCQLSMQEHACLLLLTMVFVRADTLVTKPESARLPML